MAGDRVTILDAKHDPPTILSIVTVARATGQGIWTPEGDETRRWSIRDGGNGWTRQMIRPHRAGDEREVRLTMLRGETERARMAERRVGAELDLLEANLREARERVDELANGIRCGTRELEDARRKREQAEQALRDEGGS